ncbi:hypothetical protein [Cohnella rhizosphaerae]|uniref:Uncharacterized protein n=1 Tax=Cohnella rhizosphaerae TaxID=1457232 RepID=A0A9X4KRN8_9BACL|nr:hypothetical protein [Cohnella rhizosphaerae]MDG0809901.1 hypothetical protein [Cohnella rhizosphaerae]
MSWLAETANSSGRLPEAIETFSLRLYSLASAVQSCTTLMPSRFSYSRYQTLLSMLSPFG